MCVGLMGCDQGGWLRDSRGRGGADITQDGTVDLQYGIGVEGNLNPCIKGLSIGFLHLKIHILNQCMVYNTTHILNQCMVYNTVLILFIFLLYKLKITM